MPGGDDQPRSRRDSQRRPPQSQAQRAKAFKKEFSRIRRSRGWLAKRNPGELLALMLEMLPPASFIDPLTGSPKTWEKELRRALAGRLKDTVVIPKAEWPSSPWQKSDGSFFVGENMRNWLISEGSAR